MFYWRRWTFWEILFTDMEVWGDIVSSRMCLIPIPFHFPLVTLSPFHDPLLRVLLPLLMDPKPLSVRKRAYMALCKIALNSATLCSK